MTDKKDLLKLHYDTFAKQDPDTKLDTLFVMMQDIRANSAAHCIEQRKFCDSKFKRLESRGKWDKLYAAIGGGIAAVTVLVSKAFFLGGD